MKTIAIFCDGTWNSPHMTQPTHVFSLFDALDKSDNQQPVYFEGVGTGNKFTTFFGKWASKIGGGAFGWGLGANVKAAYLALAGAYEADDQIMIFGFSRGAFTARSLAGMVRKCGLPDRTALSNRVANRAYRLYKKGGRENHPNKMHIMRERRQISPSYATSDVDMRWRADNSSLLKIAYLGVWDTVGALGIPKNLLGPVAKIWNRRYEFHDTDLSSMVKSARHAVALDERREFFEPAKWENIDKTEKNDGLNEGDVSDDRPYQQIWFVGKHSIVGGSNEHNRAISAITMKWIFDGAQKLGLTLKSGRTLSDVAPDPTITGHEIDYPGEIYDHTPDLISWREGPAKEADCDASVRERLDAVASYRPGSLKRLRPDLIT